jgi:hypothetical protein
MTLAPYSLLTPRNFNGKQSITIDELRQRRLDHRIKRPRTTKSSTRILDEGFFFANFLPLTCEKLRSSQKRNEGLKNCHDRGMNLDASARR